MHTERKRYAQRRDQKRHRLLDRLLYNHLRTQRTSHHRAVHAERIISHRQYEQSARYQRQQAELAQRRQMDQAYQRLMQEADGVKAQYPAFDLNAEMQDPDFVRLLRAQVPLKTIYEVRHQDEILGGAMQYTAQKVAAKVAAGVSANRGRPAENGAAASGASGARFDVEHSTKEQRMALIRRAANGERIEF